MDTNKISINIPLTIFDVLEAARYELPEFSMVSTALLRYTAPVWGGPKVVPGEHMSLTAWEFAKTLSSSHLTHALRDQERYFDQVGANKACRNRNRHHLKRLVNWVTEKRWLPELTKSRTPEFNRFNKPKGQRRIYAQQLRTTNLQHPPAYALGTQEEDYILVAGEKVLANQKLDHELKQLKAYVRKFRKPKPTEAQLKQLKSVFGYLHRVLQIPLPELSLEILVPFVQLRFSEEDFAGIDAFALSSRGCLLDPIKAEQTISTAESVARRQAKKKADITLKHIEGFFAWRQQVLTELGQPEGLSSASKREALNAVILACKYQYRDQTDSQETDSFEDIPVIQQLRLKIKQHPLDRKKTQKQIRKRSVSWPRAMRVLEQQRLQALEYKVASRDPTRKSGRVIRNRTATDIANDIQKTVVLGLMTLIPTDRQQTYRNLKYGITFRNGHFLDDDCEQFVDAGIPTQPDKAQFWINLEDFKTADKYGEFWYPVPNVQFVDGTTFYQLIAAWLWGFEDKEETWPTYYRENHEHWQGHIDANGNRCGWRAALEPQHDFMFTMPIAKTAFHENSFCAMIRGIFVRFTQEDGPPVPVTPHSFRHMLSGYLDSLGISGEEEKSFSYVLHHSPEVHQGRYVYRDNMARIAPAVKRMEQIIKSFL